MMCTTTLNKIREHSPCQDGWKMLLTHLGKTSADDEPVTLNKIREHSPCQDGWKKLLTHLGKATADDEPVTLKIILESNGLDDALWCLRASDATEFEMRRFSRFAALDVAHLWDMPAIVRDYLKTGDETKRAAARDDAWGAAAMSARVAAMYAARAAAQSATLDAQYAAGAAAGNAARASARAATLDAQYAAGNAARATARKIQTERFISMFCMESDGTTQHQLETRP